MLTYKIAFKNAFMIKIKKLKISQKKSKTIGLAFTLSIKTAYSTVTDFAKFLGWSTLQPLNTAI
jgi:hypothetical protein